MSFSPEDGAGETDPLNNTLWRLEFADGNLCVAEAAEQLYLVLFTSTERAREFVADSAVEGAEPVSAVVFSENDAEFRQAAQWACAEGMHGAVIDPHPSGRVHTTVEFAAPEQTNGA